MAVDYTRRKNNALKSFLLLNVSYSTGIDERFRHFVWRWERGGGRTHVEKINSEKRSSLEKNEKKKAFFTN